MLTTCVGLSVVIPRRGSGPVQVKPKVDVGPIAVVVKGIRAKLGHARNEIPTRRAQLRPFNCEPSNCYAARDVEKAVAAVREEVATAFPDVALASRLTIDAEIAAALQQAELRRVPQTIELARNGPKATAYAESVVDAIFARIGAHIDQYLTHAVLNPAIDVSSDPPGADFDMTIGDNDKTRCHTQTNDVMQSVWRGRYTAVATKAGYREVRGFEVNLIRDDRTKVRCTLVPLSAPPSDKSACRLDE